MITFIIIIYITIGILLGAYAYHETCSFDLMDGMLQIFLITLVWPFFMIALLVDQCD